MLATEDHDLAEVNHVALLSEHGLPERLTVESQAFAGHAVDDAPVGTVKFGPEIEPVVERAAALLGDSEVETWLREAYRPGESLGSAFALLFARLFADSGVILLDPAEKDFHDLVISTYGRGIYILDDISPLEQMAKNHSDAAATLFEPRQNYRFTHGGIALMRSVGTAHRAFGGHRRQDGRHPFHLFAESYVKIPFIIDVERLHSARNRMMWQGLEISRPVRIHRPVHFKGATDPVQPLFLSFL